MSKIKPISATNSGGEKSDVYRLLNLLHATAGRCAVAGVDSWRLGGTCTTDDYVLTTWTNGIIDITAETWPDFGEHTYTMRPCEEQSK